MLFSTESFLLFLHFEFHLQSLVRDEDFDGGEDLKQTEKNKKKGK